MDGDDRCADRLKEIGTHNTCSQIKVVLVRDFSTGGKKRQRMKDIDAQFPLSAGQITDLTDYSRTHFLLEVVDSLG